MNPIEPGQITAVVLAGGRGSRMGGVDKGLQNFNGTPLALHSLLRLQMQSGGLVGEVMINANRNLAAYESLGVPVWPDSIDGFAGPLAGFLTGLEHCETPLLLTVPCDSPRLPLDLAALTLKTFERATAAYGGGAWSTMVVKLLEGTQGIGVVLCETQKAAESVIEAFIQTNNNILVQEYIREANGADNMCREPVERGTC